MAPPRSTDSSSFVQCSKGHTTVNENSHVLQRLAARLLQSVCILLVLLGTTLPAAAQGQSAHVRPEAATLEVGAGQMVLLNLVLEDATEVYGIDLRANFDPAAVEVVDADAQREGIQMIPGPFLKPDFMVRNVVDNTAGTLRYVITQVNPTEPASGAGVVLSLILRGKAVGAQSVFTINFIDLVDRRGNKLPTEPQNSALTVIDPKPGMDIPAAVAAILAKSAPAPTVAAAAPAVAAPAAPPQASVAGAVVRIDPATVSLAPGQTATAALIFDGAENVYGTEVGLRFDPQLLEVVDSDQAQSGVQVESGGWLANGFVAVNKADNSAGTLDFAGTLVNPAPPVSGHQVIATLTFKAKGNGTVSLNVTKAVLADRDGQSIAATLQSGQVTVALAGQVAAPATSLAAASPAASQSDSLVPTVARVGSVVAIIGAGVLFGLYWRRRSQVARR